MTRADKLVHLTQQLIGDISRLPGVVLDSGGEAQLVQLLTDAFEVVGHLALEEPTERCTLANCNLVYAHRHPSTVQVTAYPGDIIT